MGDLHVGAGSDGPSSMRAAETVAGHTASCAGSICRRRRGQRGRFGTLRKAGTTSSHYFGSFFTIINRLCSDSGPAGWASGNGGAGNREQPAEALRKPQRRSGLHLAGTGRSAAPAGAKPPEVRQRSGGPLVWVGLARCLGRRGGWRGGGPNETAECRRLVRFRHGFIDVLDEAFVRANARASGFLSS